MWKRWFGVLVLLTTLAAVTLPGCLQIEDTEDDQQVELVEDDQ